jgi:hypothetical protein
MIRLPGISEIPSPDGQYSLINIDDEKIEPSHYILLKNLKTKKEEKLYSYSRYVEILWGPDSKGLILNDHGGSDYTNCIVILLNEKKMVIDIKDQLKKYMGDNQTILGNHHVYIEGIEWLSNKKIKVRIKGYGDIDPDGFVLWYEYSIGKDFQFIKRDQYDK